jgi:hypothetical protein
MYFVAVLKSVFELILFALLVKFTTIIRTIDSAVSSAQGFVILGINHTAQIFLTWPSV